MCGTPWDRSPEDGTGPLEDGVGPREHFSPGPGPEKKVIIIFATLDVSGHWGIKYFWPRPGEKR